MIWTLRDNKHLSPPYKITGGIQGYSVWLNTPTSIDRIGWDIKSLANAKAFAQLHAQGDKRVNHG